MAPPLNDIKRINDILINPPQPANDGWLDDLDDFYDDDYQPEEGDEEYGYYNEDDEWVWY